MYRFACTRNEFSLLQNALRTNSEFFLCIDLDDVLSNLNVESFKNVLLNIKYKNNLKRAMLSANHDDTHKQLSASIRESSANNPFVIKLPVISSHKSAITAW